MTVATALIAEDEAPQRLELRRMLSDLWPELEVVAECGDGLAALEGLAAHRPRVAFLDIRMPGLSGLEVARAASRRAHVVFTTAYEQYALDAFDEGAVDYLLKPIDRERLRTTIARLQARLADGSSPDIDALIDRVQSKLGAGTGSGIKWITASAGSTVKMYSLDEVLFFQAQDKYTHVVTEQDEAYIRTPLRELIRALDPEVFWQVHRSVIVRVGAIRSVTRGSDGKLELAIRGRTDALPISSAFHYRFKAM